MNLIDFYQNLPSRINPIAFHIGFFSIGWYSLMYLLGVLVIYLLLHWRIKRKEGGIGLSFKKMEELLLWLLLGAIVGGRLGYVFFYEPSYFFSHPLAIISPFDGEGNLVGIYGLSYHGGLLGVIMAGWIFARRNKLVLWKLADFVVPAISAGYFFGRLGNFFNGELYGRLTHSQWGMNFYNPYILDWELRVPSQLVEAFFEGLVLFLILWSVRNKKIFQGYLLSLYLLGYGVFRLGIEFVREPDVPIGYVAKIGSLGITLGQVYSLLMIGLAVGLFFFQKRLVKLKK